MQPLTKYRTAIFSILALLLALILRKTGQPILPDDVVRLTAILLPFSELKAESYAVRWLKSKNFSVSTQLVSKNRLNVLALLPDASISDVRVVLSTHLDVVPGKGRPEGLPMIDGEKLRGRGSVDARGQAAALMLAMKNIRDKRVALLLVAGEETDHEGMKRAQELGLRGTLVNAEPTESKIAVRQKGVAKVVLRAKGKAAHSGYPELGISATHALVQCLQGILLRDWGAETTVNVGTMEGGSAANVVAESAEAIVSFRLGSSDVDVEGGINCENVEAELVARVEPMEYVVPERMANVLGTVKVNYNTDAAYWKGGDAVVFGAGSIHKAHGRDEWIDVQELGQMAGNVQGIVEELLEKYSG